MTLQDLLNLIDSRPLPTLAYFLSLPLSAWLAGRFHPRGNVHTAPLRYTYSTLLFLTSIPGILATVALADTLSHGRLMQAGVLSELLPIVAMLATIGVVRQQADPRQIPGFQRITGFMLLLALTAFGVFLLTKTRIWIIFGGGIGSLLIAVTVLFFLLKWAFERAFGAGRR